MRRFGINWDSSEVRPCRLQKSLGDIEYYYKQLPTEKFLCLSINRARGIVSYVVTDDVAGMHVIYQGRDKTKALLVCQMTIIREEGK